MNKPTEKETEFHEAVVNILESFASDNRYDVESIPNHDEIAELFETAIAAGRVPSPKKVSDLLSLQRRVDETNFYATMLSPITKLDKHSSRLLQSTYEHSVSLRRYLGRQFSALEGGACSVDKAVGVMNILAVIQLPEVDAKQYVDTQDNGRWNLPRKGTLHTWLLLARQFVETQSSFDFRKLVEVEEEVRKLYVSNA